MNKRFLYYLGIILICCIYFSCKNSHATQEGNKEVNLAELIKETYSAAKPMIQISVDNLFYKTRQNGGIKIDTVFVQGEFLIFKKSYSNEETSTYYFPLKNLKTIAVLEKYKSGDQLLTIEF